MLSFGVNLEKDRKHILLHESHRGDAASLDAELLRTSILSDIVHHCFDAGRKNENAKQFGSPCCPNSGRAAAACKACRSAAAGARPRSRSSVALSGVIATD